MRKKEMHEFQMQIEAILKYGYKEANITKGVFDILHDVEKRRSKSASEKR